MSTWCVSSSQKSCSKKDTLSLRVPSADVALAMLEQGSDPRVVVTDEHMPGELNGFELAQVICRRWPHIGVVIVSGRLRPSKDDLPDESRFLSKPVSPAALTSTVQAVAAMHD